jgi:hypothetical protein
MKEKQPWKFFSSNLGGFDAVKQHYPHLIECAVEIPREKHEHDHIPPSPDTVDKENFIMTEILPRIFVGKFRFYFFVYT